MQGFAPSLCRDAWMVRNAAVLPSTIYDLTPDGQKTLLARRISGQNPVNWYGQSPKAIRSMPQPVFIPFAVVMLGEEENLRDYDAWLAQSPVSATIVARKGGHLTFADLSPETLQKRFLEVCETIPDVVDAEDIASARKMLADWDPVPVRKLGYQVGGHNSVTPNLMVLASAGYGDSIYGPFKDINGGIAPYVDQLVRTSESIFSERVSVGERDMQRIFRPTIDLNLFAPAIYPHFLQTSLPPGLSREEQKSFRLAREALDHQTGYNFQLTNEAAMQAVLGIDPNLREGMKQRPRPHPLVIVRSEELGLATYAMGALAVSEVSAVLRLPNDINRTTGLVRTFAEALSRS